MVEAEWLEAQNMDLLHQLALDATGPKSGIDNTTDAGGKLEVKCTHSPCSHLFLYKRFFYLLLSCFSLLHIRILTCFSGAAPT